MIPDDTAGRPLTPGEQAAIADLEQRLLEAPAPVRDHLRAARPVRFARVSRRNRTRPSAAVPLVALFVVACALVALLIATGGGLLGIAAVAASVAATALVWPLLPAGLGGPVRPARRPYRSPGAGRGRP